MDYLNSGVDVNKGNSFVSIIKDITKNKINYNKIIFN